jgi:hypothetical protein
VGEPAHRAGHTPITNNCARVIKDDPHRWVALTRARLPVQS